MLLGGIRYLLPVIKAAHEQGYYGHPEGFRSIGSSTTTINRFGPRIYTTSESVTARVTGIFIISFLELMKQTGWGIISIHTGL